MRQVGVAVIVGVAAALPWLNKFANNLLLPCLSATPGAAAAAASSPAAAASLRNVSRRALDARRDQGQCACCVSNLCHCRLRCAPLIHPLIIPLPPTSLCNPLTAAHPLLLLLYLGLYFCFFFSFCCCFPCFLYTFPYCCFFFFSFFFVFCVFFSCASSGQQKNATTTRKKKNYIYYSNRCAKCWKVACAFCSSASCLGRPSSSSAPSGRLGLVVDVLIVVLLLLLLLLLRLLLLTLEPKGI